MSSSNLEFSDIHWIMNLIDSIDVGVVVIDEQYEVHLWNGFMEHFCGIPAFNAVGEEIFKTLKDLPKAWFNNHCQRIFNSHHRAFSSWEIRPYITKMRTSRPVSSPDEWMFQNVVLIPLTNVNGDIKHIALLIYDVSEVSINQRLLTSEIDAREQTNQQLAAQYAKTQALLEELEQAQLQLVQSEKMASIGQLAAGVAHEINNPIGFVNSNFHSLTGYISDLNQLITAYEAIADSVDPDSPAAVQLQELKDNLDFEFMLEDLNNLVTESQDGIDRVKNIVQGLKDFSHVGEERWEQAHLNACIDSTLNICWNEIKYKATVEKEYADLPAIDCIPSQLNQVFMNLLINAAQAIEKEGIIRIKTQSVDGNVAISISDNGNGIPEDKINKIFDPFFTTKPVGKGTGLGLAIAYGIVEKHNGKIEVESRIGEGTTFTMTFPKTRPPETGADSNS